MTWRVWVFVRLVGLGLAVGSIMVVAFLGLRERAATGRLGDAASKETSDDVDLRQGRRHSRREVLAAFTAAADSRRSGRAR